MANPAPTLNQINAFNVTIGTTIDFNIIGGTEVIRSNRIYIYDLSDNSLICTHLYVSTESIHELPSNTDSSIVYESGKSSSDFTNNTQYYAQIQTYTDTNGTQGASGLSVAKLFWCLPTPTLTLGTIPTTISTTSYNVSATYTSNTSGDATNGVQEFQFNLYSAIGALLQTSGVVLYGDGVELSYNFSGLEVDSTYYVTLDVTTTQGMSVSAQSDTFTVSIDTPTMGSASVVNNACDGYISVTSNLSSEYSHEYSVDAGEVMSFTTDSPNDIKELQVDFHPTQNGTPWMSSTPDTTPYLFRASPQLGHSYNSKLPTIVGGSVVGNQLVKIPTVATQTINGVTFTNNGDGSITVNGTATADAVYDLGSFSFPKVGKYVITGCPSGGSLSTYYLGNANAGDIGSGWAWDITSVPSATGFRIYVKNGTTVSNKKFVPQCKNLTAMLGTSIADRAYTMEQAQAGSGIAWLKSYGFISDEYEEYDSGTLKSVEATKHVTRGFNQWDEDWEVGSISQTTGNPNATISANTFRSKNYCPCIGGETYYGKTPNTMQVIYWYDANKAFIGSVSIINRTRTAPNNARFFKLDCRDNDTYTNDICINISDPSKNGTYEPYVSYEYALDSDLVLRGVPKVDANDNIYYDGDLYYADGTVDRRWGNITYDGTETGWTKHSSGRFYLASLPSGMDSSASARVTACGFDYDYEPSSTSYYSNHTFQYGSAGIYIYAVSADETLEQFKTRVASRPLHVVYPLVPTTESADPFTSPMLCDPNGTEEWVTDNGVPVGQSTTYADIYPISGWTGANVVVSPTLDAQDGTTYPISWQTEAGTVYGGTVDVISGLLTVDMANVDMGTLAWTYNAGYNYFYAFPTNMKAYEIRTNPLLCSNYETISDGRPFAQVPDFSIYNATITSPAVCVKDSRYSDAIAFKTAMNGVQLVYELATPQTYQLTPQQIQTLVGQNNLWSDTNGEMTIVYQLPITDLLVKRKDVSQVGSQWLTLHSVPVEQASDMDFTFIDFLNQYGKKYQYALVPVLAQDQSGVVVQIEGGYTVSDNVDSIFDGVYIADQTNVERVKAGVGYGNVDMNQNIGTIVPIGSKYPVVITNSQNQYHNGSIRGKIVPNDFYSNGNLSRMDMVNKRDELEQFLTNKRAKIIKDWNGKMWLVMILSNINCTFDDNYGMGMVEFSADWVEIGDPTTQQDLYNAGLINVGGV